MTDVAELSVAAAPPDAQMAAAVAALPGAGVRPVGTAQGGLASWIAEAKALAHLAAPLVVTQLAQMAVLTTDVIMLGRLSKTALASAAIGNTVFYFTWLIGSGPVSAVAPMIAQAIGANPNAVAEVRRITRMGLWSILILCTPLIPFLMFAGPVLRALHQDPVLADGAGVFVGALALGLPFSLGYQVLRNFATALGQPKAALWVMVATIGFNALGDYTLIFGHFGAPALGIRGAGIASASSYGFSFLAMTAVVRLDPVLHRYRIMNRFVRPAWAKLKEAFRLGMPIGLTMMFEAMLFNTMTLVMGTFGANTVAAHQIALNVASITFMVPLGIGMAATVRVGLAAGAEDAPWVRRAGYTAMVMAVVFIATAAIGIAALARPVAGLYLAGNGADDLQVRSLAATFLMVAAAFQFFDALQVVGALSLRGLKDARAPMILAGASYWLAGAPVCLWLGIGLHMRGLGIWIGLAFGLFVAALCMCLRFYLLTRERRPRRA